MSLLIKKQATSFKVKAVTRFRKKAVSNWMGLYRYLTPQLKKKENYKF